MNRQFDAMQKTRYNPMWGDKESDSKTLLQASILEVVSALVCSVLTVYVIGVFTSSPSYFKYEYILSIVCVQSSGVKAATIDGDWGEGGAFRTKKDHNYCHLFSRSCY